MKSPIAAGFALLVICGPAWAQATSPVTTTDEFGNARYRYRERTNLAIPIQPMPVYSSGLIAPSRRSAARSPWSPFGFPQSPFSRGRFSRAGGATLPGAESVLPRAYQMYGGFESRSGFTFGTVAQSLQRRQALLQATALNAPVRRALAKNTAYTSPRLQIEAVPFVTEQSTDETGEPVSIDIGLQAKVDQSREALRAEAWALFDEGEHQRAARAFATAASLSIGNEQLECRVGELFCHAATGAMRTAEACVNEILVRVDNPFVLADELAMADRFRSASDAGDLVIQARLFASRNPADPVAAALHVVALWYMGRYDEALVAAAPLSRESSGRFARWPQLMRAARPAPNNP